jgi:hypothetical protein
MLSFNTALYLGTTDFGRKLSGAETNHARDLNIPQLIVGEPITDRHLIGIPFANVSAWRATTRPPVRAAVALLE